MRLVTTRAHAMSIANIEVFGNKDSSKKVVAPVTPPSVVEPVSPPSVVAPVSPQSVVAPVSPPSVEAKLVELHEISVEGSQPPTARNPPSNVFKKGSYSRSDRKTPG